MARRRKQQGQSRQKKRAGSNMLRIIGGQWRSRKLPFVDAVGLRPTPDRIRETLFNWLRSDIHGASCLDLFAGSGALGFEALSRGAKPLVFIEKDRLATEQLRQNLDLLNASALVFQTDALDYLSTQATDALDIIFLDPPYRKGLLDKSLTLINDKALLKPQGLIYLEHESEERYQWDSYGLNVLKEATAGQVKCYLLGRNTES